MGGLPETGTREFVCLCCYLRSKLKLFFSLALSQYLCFHLIKMSSDIYPPTTFDLGLIPQFGFVPSISNFLLKLPLYGPSIWLFASPAASILISAMCWKFFICAHLYSINHLFDYLTVSFTVGSLLVSYCLVSSFLYSFETCINTLSSFCSIHPISNIST